MKTLEMNVLNPLVSLKKKINRLLVLDQRSSPEQFLLFFKPHRGYLFNFIMKLMNFSPDAEDVYQDTVLRAFKYFRTYNPKHPFKTWLFSIALNEVKKHRRKWNHTLTVTLEEAGPLMRDPGNADQVRMIFNLALGLKPKSREVFFLFYQGGFTVQEISQMSGLSQGNVKYILNQSREKIKKQLETGNEIKME